MSDSPLRVLLVDDSPSDTALLRAYMSRSSIGQIEITEADDLEAGKHMLKERRYDVVLLDYYLPKGSAVELLSYMRKHMPDTPVIVITGAYDEAIAEEVLLAGATDFLHKGELSTRSLMRVIRHAQIRARVSARR